VAKDAGRVRPGLTPAVRRVRGRGRVTARGGTLR
jgi:hypothetical protein